MAYYTVSWLSLIYKAASLKVFGVNPTVKPNYKAYSKFRI
jgi:hypothetical protein